MDELLNSSMNIQSKLHYSIGALEVCQKEKHKHILKLLEEISKSDTTTDCPVFRDILTKMQQI